MSRLDSIGVRVEGTGSMVQPSAAAGLGGGVTALAFEIAGLLDQLSASAQPGMIDLRSLPLSPADRLALEALLGQGEIAATIDADGLSTIRETSISGVWWSQYRDLRGQLVAEVIEVCAIPEILVSDQVQLAAGASQLRQRLAGHAV